MEIRKAGQTLVGFPALIDKTTHVEIEVFDEPAVAATTPRRPAAIGCAATARTAEIPREEPARPECDGSAVPQPRHAEELRAQIVEVALDRAFLADPLPHDEASFKARLEEGRTRLTLIAQEVARQAHAVLLEYANATRKLRDARPPKDVHDDITAQLQRLVSRRFVAATPWVQQQHLPRYLRAIQMRLDKLRADPAVMRSGWPSCGRWSSATGAVSPNAKVRAMRASMNSAG